jgi:hypothetical protein
MRCQPCRWVSHSDPVRHERTDSETVEEFFLEGPKQKWRGFAQNTNATKKIWYGEAFVVGYVAYFTIAYA